MCRLAGKAPEFCGSDPLKPEALGPFEDALAFYMRTPYPTTQAVKLHSFWGHEWARCVVWEAGWIRAGSQQTFGVGPACNDSSMS